MNRLLDQAKKEPVQIFLGILTFIGAISVTLIQQCTPSYSDRVEIEKSESEEYILSCKKIAI